MKFVGLCPPAIRRQNHEPPVLVAEKKGEERVKKGKKKSPSRPFPSLQIYHRNPIWAPAFPCKPLLFTK